MVPVVIDKSGCMEESAGDVKGNGVDGFKRVTQKTSDDGLVVIEGFNGRGAEDLDETMVLKEDGGGLWDESMEVSEAEVRGVDEGLALWQTSCWRHADLQGLSRTAD